jgi:hypothetical protein
MFQELMPLLAQRVVMLTATRINPDLICVNIIPQRLKSGNENNEAGAGTSSFPSDVPTSGDLFGHPGVEH